MTMRTFTPEQKAQRAAISKSWAKENPEKVRAKSRAWCARNREKSRANTSKWQANNPLSVKRNTYLNTYKLATEQDFQHYLATDACECCGKSFDDKLIKHQHHDHDTGKLIGVWCRRCNSAEGHLDVNSSYQVACKIAENTPLMELIAIATGSKH